MERLSSDWRPASGDGRPASDWVAGPVRPVLPADSLHVWRADLATVADDVMRSLCARERERAARCLNPSKGLAWARARSVLRLLLGRYLEIDPAAIELWAGEHGKPSLRPGAAQPHLFFNLSHSDSLALYAFSRTGAVGVDVQARRALRGREPAIARRAFGGTQAARLERLPSAAHERLFLRAWVRHEAALKCCGRGIWSSCDSTRTGPDGRDGGRETDGARCDQPCCDQPWIAELDLGAEVACAVAASRPLELRRFEFSCLSAA